MSALLDHLRTGTTTVCHCWRLDRGDGVVLGFTDHDLDLAFDGVVFRADSGMTAKALMQTTGLSVDNTEAVGALSSDAITEADILAGRWDGAEVMAFTVNWADVAQRSVLFRGTVGALRREGSAFAADLRSMASALNRPVGRVYQKPCTAVLGDATCRFDLTLPGYGTDLDVLAVDDTRLVFPPQPGFDPGWFARGHLTVLTGAAAGLAGAIKGDVALADGREVTLWAGLRATIVPGDRVRLVAGCDKRFDTCRFKFLNTLNFQGFPDLPGDDWSLRLPNGEQVLDGGSRR